jgi:peptidoglycan/xylan/chitin deacetylase (PgdA/CDA1 family)
MVQALLHQRRFDSTTIWFWADYIAICETSLPFACARGGDDNARVTRFEKQLICFAWAACSLAAGSSALAQTGSPSPDALLREPQGAIVRGDVNAKKIALVFTGGHFGDAATPILDALAARHIKASFFVTGDFLHQNELQPQLRRMIAEGHYLGPHSDSHPLYCDWDERDKSLVTEEFFTADLQKNLADLRALGALPAGSPVYFIPPYEWYNHDQAEWCKKLDVQLFNFTPGTGSNRDYAPEGDKAFVPSQQIYGDILAYEQKDPHGLNGFLLLLHLGSSRKDPFHPHFAALLDELTKRGYEFVRVDELCD